MGIHFRRRISNQKYSIILRSFLADVTSIKTAQIVGVNRKTTDRYFNMFRELIRQEALIERLDVKLGNGIEVDESYFGARRIRGKRGRGARGKVIVLGILKRNGKVYSEIIKNVEKEAVMPIIRKVVQSGSDIYSDGWKSYSALAVYGYNHKKVKHSENEFARPDGTHINGVESYWSWTKRRLNKFNGISKRHFSQYLLESEWRFNHRKGMEKDLKILTRKS
jgi:transposase